MNSWLTLARIIGIFFVITQHVSEKIIFTAPLFSADWWLGNCWDSATRWVAPVFVMISGALLLNPNRNYKIQEFYIKRALKVGVPFVFWSALFSLFSLFYQGVTARETLVKIYYGNPYYHLWFLYVIMGLYLITPFLRSLLTEKGRTKQGHILTLSCFILAIVDAIVNKFFSFHLKPGPVMFLPYLSYYLAGYYLATMDDTRINSLPLLLAIFCMCSLMIAFGMGWFVDKFGHMYYGRFFYSNFNPLVILASISIFLMFKKIKFSSDQLFETSKKIFGIYLIHPLFLPVLLALLSEINTAIKIPFAAALVFAASYLSIVALQAIPYIKRIV